MPELNVAANKENLDTVLAFIDEQLEKLDCDMKMQMQFALAAEEIFVNIACYAYGDDTGSASIICGASEDGKEFFVTFIGGGTPYDPLKKPDPDVTLSAEERPIGGLGIFMVKKIMDDVSYEYKDGRNILTIKKNLAQES